jgi:hypothetical protein
MKKDDDDDDAKPTRRDEAKDDDDEAKAEPKVRPGDDAPLEELGDYWQGTDGLLKRATAHIYRRIIAPACEGGFREWMDAECLIFEGSSRKEEQKPEFFVLYKEFEERVAGALEEFVASQFDDDGTRQQRMDELSARIRAGADDGSSLKLPIDKSATMLLAAASYPKFCALMRQRCKAVQKEHEAFDALR